MIFEIDFKNLDKERKAFFYIIIRNKELLEKINEIYDFERNALKVYENIENESGNFTEEKDFYKLSSTAKRMLRIALSLYNGMKCDFKNLGCLSKENYLIIKEAIEIRFDFK